MSKKFILFLIPLIFIISSHAAASVVDYEDKKTQISQQRNELQQEIQKTDQEIINLPENEKDQAKNENIKRKMQDMKLAAYEEAYKAAIETIQGTTSDLVNINNNYVSFTPVKLNPGEGAPKEYIPIYKAAAQKYGVDWTVLAAIHKVETQYSTIKTMISSAGAIGHMQFLPSTFAAYGVDGNGDGRIDPWNLQDAIFSAAHYLSVSGYSKDVRGAIWNYNHAEWYINKVLLTAAIIKGTTYEG